MTRRPGRDTRRDLVRLFAAQVQCPDCASDAELIEHAPGVYALNIRHDETCPALRSMRGAS